MEAAGDLDKIIVYNPNANWIQLKEVLLEAEEEALAKQRS